MTDFDDSATMSDASVPNSTAPNPATKGLNADWLKARLAKTATPAADRVSHDAAGRYQPFAMTDMQQAYWLGRDPGLAGGGTMQMYHEFDGPMLDLPRLERAWNRLIQRHDMLRAVVTADGLQRVLPDVAPQSIQRIDLTALPAPAQQAALSDFRAVMLAEAPALDSWPQSRLACHLLGPDQCRLHLRLDMWCFDGRSFQIIIEDLAALYADPDTTLPETRVQFRDYVQALQRDETGPEHARSLAWWQDRLAQMPPPPPLPYKSLPEPGARPKFRRLAAALDRDQTSALKQFARQNDLGLPAVMATAYAHALSLWSGATHFTLNVPRFNRPDWHPDLNDIVGEFASFSLLEIKLDLGASFAQAAQAVQRQLWTDLEHSRVSGVRQLRELARLRGDMQTGAMPIVFTTMPERRSTEAARLERAMTAFGDLGFSLGGTPQVWVDSHYFELDGVMHFNWDTLEGLFDDGLIEAMFDSFADQVRNLAAGAEAWARLAARHLPDAQAQARAQVNDRPWKAAGNPLQQIHDHLHRDTRRLALDAPDRRLTRAELARAMASVVQTLRTQGINAGDTVGLLAARGWPQVAAALGIMFSGATYMPLENAAPAARLAGMIGNSRARAVLTDRPDLFDPERVRIIDLATLDLDADVALDPPEMGPDPARLAALIHTSGSTGIPKAVMVPWSALSHVVDYSNRHFALTPDDRALMVTGLHHDLSLYDLLGPLAAGGALITLAEGQHIDPRHALHRAAAGGATFWNSVPRLAEAMVAQAEHDGGSTAPLHRFVLGGDWVPQDLPARLSAAFAQARVTTIGGPTETTIWNIMNDVPHGPAPAQRLPYGKPIPGCSYRILDAFGRDCPDWVAGEMACGGASLALGYLNDPQASAKAFVTAPDTGARLYMTGDRGRFRPDGMIEILGRNDFQLNIGGYRADPAGIETVIETAPHVLTAVVSARQHAGGEVLCAFVQMQPGHVLQPDSLRAHCAATLPAALVPRLWIALDELPLTANGKLDRKALAGLDLPQDDAGAKAPQTPLEHLLARLWGEVLGQQMTDSGQNFFAAGGDSIMATQIIARVEQALGLRLPLSAFFTAPTIHGLAAHIATMQGAGIDAPIDALTTAKDGQSCFALPQDGVLHLTPEQERLWFVERLQPDRALYNLAFATDIEGPLDDSALRLALSDVMARHDSLRALVIEDQGRPVLHLLSDPAPPLAVEDLTAANLTQKLDRVARTESATPFDLSRDLPLRLRLLALPDGRHRLHCTFHHIAFDGWSIGIFHRDLWAAYHARLAGQAPGFAAAGSYAGYAVWRRRHQGDTAALRDWWRDRLTGRPALEPPLDHTPPQQRSFAAGLHEFTLPATLQKRVDAFARNAGATPNLVLLAAFAAASGRFSRQDEFVLGVAHAGRDHAATEDMVGFFVRNLPLAVELRNKDSFDDLLSRLRDDFLAGAERLDLPFQQIVAALPGARDPSRNPVFRVAFTYQNAPLGALETDGLRLSDAPLRPEHTHLDLDLFLWPGADGIACQAVYATELFDAATITNLCSAFVAFLDGALDAPGQPLADHALTHAPEPLRGPPAPTRNSTPLWSRIEAALADAPLAYVQADHDLRLSGQQLLDRAASLDGALSDAGVAPGALIALWADAGLDHLTGLMAALRRGSTVMPIDPMLPPAALRDRVLDVGAAAVIMGTGLAVGDLPNPVPMPLPMLRADTQGGPVEPRPATEPDAVLVLASTSGTTGQPRHPRLTQAALVNRLDWGAAQIDAGETARSLLKTSPAFVDSLAEALLPLITGHTAIGADPAAIRTPSSLMRLIHDTQPTHLTLTPSVAQALVDADSSGRKWPIRRLHLSGEALPPTLLPALRARLGRSAVILNIYGSSEVTADASAALVTDAAPSLGLPLPGCAFWLLGPGAVPVPPGAVGEIHVTGPCLADGYHNAPARGFHDWRAPDGQTLRMFATGDLARLDASGALQFLGRADQQIKLRGIRIDPLEIEQALLAQGGLRRAVVSAPDGRQLIAHVEPVDALDPSERLRQGLRDSLPPSLIPARIVVTRDWPMTASGKIIRAALPLPPVQAAPDSRPFGGLESRIAEIWADYLPAGFGATTSFFEAGGDSLQLAELHRRLEQELGRSFPLVDLFRHPSIRAQAQHLGAAVASNAAQKGRERAMKRRAGRTE